jgi:hypothetical protein
MKCLTGKCFSNKKKIRYKKNKYWHIINATITHKNESIYDLAYPQQCLKC